ncbi:MULTISPECIES: hypothetical protein [unclassified Actinobaculum]|uniref:hypothetical protein n=1 Tax=unclassified Actinobaculum TaxID=2609299 RepID=UPI000D528DE1|nr:MULTISPECIES: hypothetical protein [unclassified Actinobaculum]AWE43089.1 hypothetical protein DDD63_10455 [Actinobaculum sp. 313]RTE48525.1 hypothetical protein EKN07_09160 [Actinobaculum sp. 352]
MSNPHTTEPSPTNTSTSDTRYHITATFIRFLVLFIATYGICWLAVHEPAFHDKAYTGATVHCTPVLKAGFGPTNAGVWRHDIDSSNARSNYLDAQPDDEYTAMRGRLNAAWRDGCIAARENREALIVALTAATLGVFFAIPKKARIPLPIQRHPALEDDTVALRHGNASTHSEPSTKADPARFAPKPSNTATTESDTMP